MPLASPVAARRRRVPTLLVAVCSILGAALAWAAPPTTEPAVGIRSRKPAVHALTNAKIVVAPGQTIDRGTIVIRDGLIEAVGADVAPPDDARVYDLSGKTIYPGLIEIFSELSGESAPSAGRSAAPETPSPTPGRPRFGQPAQPAAAPAAPAGYWNSNVTPQTRAADSYRIDAEANKRWRSQGFVARQIAPSRGILRGTTAVVTTGDDPISRGTLVEEAALVMLLRPQGRFGGEYPTSPMGAMALVRQALHDADWYGKAWAVYRQQDHQQRPEYNQALAALLPYAAGDRPVIVEAPDEQYFLRAHGIGQEFGLSLLVLGSGEEYKRLAEIKATGRPVIVPVNFPRAPDVKTPESAQSVSLAELLHWDLAPDNPGRLDKAGVRIALTSHGLRGSEEFLANVRTAVKRGLSADAALRALTITPAEMLGLEGRLGSLQAGKQASLLVADGDLFAKDAKVLETWVDGARHEAESAPLVDARGTWELTVSRADAAAETVTLKVEGTPGRLRGRLSKDDRSAAATLDLSDYRLSLSTRAERLGWQGIVRMTLVLTDDGAGGLQGQGAGQWADGEGFGVSAERTAAYQPEADQGAESASDDEKAKEGKKPDEEIEKPDDEESPEDRPRAPGGPGGAGRRGSFGRGPRVELPKAALYPPNYPLGSAGFDQPPERPEAVLLRNATVWTSGPAGILDKADVLVRHGRIAEVGAGLAAPEGAVVVDASGKHITPGIIDCHSHIATDGGVNEVGQAVTAEVRIGDFIDGNDLNIYRQTAGGVTTSNILHGSANPIGGQNQVIKLRWSLPAEQLKVADAPPGIKFALGENVKQSNSQREAGRYPQSRMGVEQILRDEFRAAQDYKRSWEAWRADRRGLPPRVDLELQALVEILDGQRLIHCHSYRQDEILMLLRTCEDLGIKIATLQHVLEGYKVADAIARHGAGGSSFSDWWAYKIEVYDAIPYNGALLHRAGVVTSFNSDDAEMARRLNQEAGKALKYGQLAPADALALVTINPARQLRIDGRVGSLEVGKDADLVVWSGPPLSNYSRCEQTWIDGRKYFDRQDDAARRAEAKKKKAALVQRVLALDAPTEGPGERRPPVRDWWARHDEYCGHSHDDEEQP